jgi:serine/threonine-protein kinase
MTDPDESLPQFNDPQFETVIDAIADGQDVDWDDLQSKAASSNDRELIDRLRILADVLRVHRHLSVDPFSTGPRPTDDASDSRREHSGHESNAESRVRLTAWGPLSIRAEVGSGSFGTVFRAWDPRLDREVALKLLHFQSIDATAASAVINEGHLLAQIRHPNVVTVFGADYFEGAVGLWMEFVKGQTLKDILREQGAYSSQEARVIGLDLCHALAAVHHAGCLHCDIKAQNVMRESGGRIVLMDFGAGAVINPNAELPIKMLGTPLYMAPEVLMGDRPTVRSDLYSLGILLYHLVSGEFPVTGGSPDELRKAHLQGRRRLLRDVRPDLPSAFVHLVDVATAALLDQRPDSAGAMEILLEEAAGHRPRKLRNVSADPGHVDSRNESSIAVIPFLDLSPEKTLEYFCDGIAEEIIDGLASVPGLRVVGRSSAFQFKGRVEDVRRIGSALNVATVLEGSVRASGDRLRIISRLIDTAEGRQLWSEKFERGLGDVFAVQDEIARAAVGALRVRAGKEMVSPAAVPSTPTTRNLEAYNLYLKARHYWNKRTEASLQKSAALFQAAIESDPNYAEGHAGLAEAYATLGSYGVLPPHEAMPRAQTAAERALDLRGTLSSPYATLGCVASLYRWRWREAEQAYRRAIDLNPNHPAAHHWYAINHLVPLSRFEEADRELRSAMDVDPISTPVRVSLGLRFYFAHQYTEAEDELRNSFELDAGSVIARLFLGLTLVEIGRHDDAVRELNIAIQLSDSPEMTAALGYASARAGNIDRAREVLNALVNLSSQRYVSPSLVAQIYAGLGDTVSSLDWLEKAGDVHAADLAWLAVRPVFNGLRGETRFKTLLQRLHL